MMFYNNLFHHLYRILNIFSLVKSMSLQLLALETWIGSQEIYVKCWCWKSLGKIKGKGKDILKKWFWGYEVNISLAQDHVHWQDLILLVLKFHVLHYQTLRWLVITAIANSPDYYIVWPVHVCPNTVSWYKMLMICSLLFSFPSSIIAASYNPPIFSMLVIIWPPIQSSN
jgi:hypothetical protein